MRVFSILLLVAASFTTDGLVADDGPSAFVSERVPHPGSDQIFWVPTFAQAERMAKDTGRLMLVMGSVSDFSGY